MRLIRLQTDHDNCMFDNSFQDDILIQPGAKIALQNVCILKTPESVYILATWTSPSHSKFLGRTMRPPPL